MPPQPKKTHGSAELLVIAIQDPENTVYRSKVNAKWFLVRNEIVKTEGLLTQ